MRIVDTDNNKKVVSSVKFGSVVRMNSGFVGMVLDVLSVIHHLAPEGHITDAVTNLKNTIPIIDLESGRVIMIDRNTVVTVLDNATLTI